MPAVDPGPIVESVDVEHAVILTLKQWVPYYLARLDEKHDLEPGTTIPPRTYVAASDNVRWPEQVPPALVVVSQGTIDTPERHGASASYAAWWQFNVVITTGGATEKGTRALASRHAAAVYWALGQQPDLQGVALDTVWLGARTDGELVIGRRRLAACEVLAKTHIHRVMDTRGLIPRTVPTPPTDPAEPSVTPTGSRVVINRRS